MFILRCSILGILGLLAGGFLVLGVDRNIDSNILILTAATSTLLRMTKWEIFPSLLGLNLALVLGLVGMQILAYFLEIGN